MPSPHTIHVRDHDWDLAKDLIPALQEDHPMGMSIRNRGTVVSMAVQGCDQHVTLYA